MIYGTLRFVWFDGPLAAELTGEGWRCPDPDIADTLNQLAPPSDFGPADGDQMACALAKAAGMFNGTYTVVPLPSQPPGTIY